MPLFLSHVIRHQSKKETFVGIFFFLFSLINYENTRAVITSWPSVFGARGSTRNRRARVVIHGDWLRPAAGGNQTVAVTVMTIDENKTNARIQIYVNRRRSCASRVNASNITFITVPRGPKDNRCYYFITVYYTIFFPLMTDRVDRHIMMNKSALKVCSPYDPSLFSS